jgi:hypothetical protein
VKPTACVPAFCATSLPTVAPSPVTTLIAPSGIDVSWMTSAIFIAMTDVDGAGTQTRLFPQAIPGARYSMGMATG